MHKTKTPSLPEGVFCIQKSCANLKTQLFVCKKQKKTGKIIGKTTKFLN